MVSVWKRGIVAISTGVDTMSPECTVLGRIRQPSALQWRRCVARPCWFSCSSSRVPSALCAEVFCMGIDSMRLSAAFCGRLALPVFVVALLGFGAALEGYSQWVYPVAWLGAEGMPGAIAFNVAGFVLPGSLAAFALWSLRPALPPGAPWSARIGAQLVVLSALAFSIQGLLPINPEDPDAGAHGTAWTLWWLTFSAGAWALAWGLRRISSRPRVVLTWVLPGVIVPALALLAPQWVANAVAQRAAFLLWFSWVAWIVQHPRSHSGTEGTG